MTLYELSDSLTLQGNIEVKVFDNAGTEAESRKFRDMDGFHSCMDAPDLEHCDVTYMYGTADAAGTAWMVIEVEAAEVDDDEDEDYEENNCEAGIYDCDTCPNNGDCIRQND